MFKEREERQIEKEGRQHGETKVTTSKPYGRKGEKTTTTTLYWNADTKQWQRQFIRKKPPTPKEQDDRLRIEANEQKRAKIEAQRNAGDIFPDLRGGGGDIPASVIAQKEADSLVLNEKDGGSDTGSTIVSDQQEVGQEQLTLAAQQVRDAHANLLLVRQGANQQQVLADVGGQEYTTNFREAFRNANKSQAWEDTMDSDAPLEKSNVFSKAAMDWGMYKAGDTLGVMTRNQRRAYDQAVADAAINKANKANNVVEQDEATGGSGVYKPNSDPNKVIEWTTDQEANEEGKLVDAANKIDINQEPKVIFEEPENEPGV